MQKLNEKQIANVSGGIERCKCFYGTTATSNLVLADGVCKTYCCTDGVNTAYSTMPAHLDERTNAPARHRACPRRPIQAIPSSLFGSQDDAVPMEVDISISM